MVEKGDLIEAAVENVGRMFRRKVDAVRCIADKAEKLATNFEFNETEAEEFQYYSSKYSTINGVPCSERMETKTQCTEFEIVKNATKTLYKNMTLTRNKHFYHINVNTQHTSVHVPTNVYDEGEKQFIISSNGFNNFLKYLFFNRSRTDESIDVVTTIG